MTDTVASALREASARLAATSDSPRLDAELLMAEALGVSRSDLLLRHHASDVPDTFAELLRRRLAREPVAYILGRREFFGRDFRVTRDTLIPRGDSEAVVEAALDVARPDARVLDCGTGTGALLLTFLAERSAASGVGIDASPGAIAVAAANADALGLTGRAQLMHRDWNAPGWADDLGRYDLLIANPPYVESGAALAPDVRDFEPASALFAGDDGLDDYRVLVPQLAQLLTQDGVAVLEIGFTQANAVSEIARSHGFSAEVRQDLGGRDRALILRLTLGKGESTS